MSGLWRRFFCKHWAAKTLKFPFSCSQANLSVILYLLRSIVKLICVSKHVSLHAGLRLVFSFLCIEFPLKISNYCNRWIGLENCNQWQRTFLLHLIIFALISNRGDDAEISAGLTANPQPSPTETCMTQALTSPLPPSNRVTSPLATNSNNVSSSSSSSISSAQPQVRTRLCLHFKVMNT